jgi:DNA polymerase III sliding clamp (beta) subunit (PCNA family)
LTEFLGAAGTKEVALGTTTPAQPCRLSAVGVEGWTHIIMPMHIKKEDAK